MSSDSREKFKALAESVVVHWDCVNPVLTLLKYRENAVFEVRGDENFRAALRVHRQYYHPDNHLEGELKWMAMLAESGLVVPRPIPTSTAFPTSGPRGSR